MEKLSKNYRFFRRHFGELAKRHGGRVIVIAGGRIVGTCRTVDHRRVAGLVARARQAHPKDTPFISRMPTTKELATSFLV